MNKNNNLGFLKSDYTIKYIKIKVLSKQKITS